MENEDLWERMYAEIEEERKRIRAKKPSERSHEEWVELIEADFTTMEENSCPLSEFSPEEWKRFILEEPIILQYDPPVRELLKNLRRDDFENWSSYDICQALSFEGQWLVEHDLLPLEKITQEDFDFYFGATPFPTAEEFWDVAPGYFPKGFPQHVKLPFPPIERRKKAEEED